MRHLLGVRRRFIRLEVSLHSAKSSLLQALFAIQCHPSIGVETEAINRGMHSLTTTSVVTPPCDSSGRLARIMCFFEVGVAFPMFCHTWPVHLLFRGRC